MRAVGPLGDDPLVHTCALTYASDMTLLDAVRIPVEPLWGPRNFDMASLDHAMWFHRPFRADEWFLYDQESPIANGGRGLARGRIYDLQGRLLVSVVQEGLFRSPVGPWSTRRRRDHGRERVFRARAGRAGCGPLRRSQARSPRDDRGGAGGAGSWSRATGCGAGRLATSAGRTHASQGRRATSSGCRTTTSGCRTTVSAGRRVTGSCACAADFRGRVAASRRGAADSGGRLGSSAGRVTVGSATSAVTVRAIGGMGVCEGPGSPTALHGRRDAGRARRRGPPRPSAPAHCAASRLRPGPAPS